jgi:hypothetical protein
MHKQVLSLTAGLKAKYLIDLKVFWTTAVLGAAKRQRKQTRETLKIKRLSALGLRAECLSIDSI